MSKKKFEGAIWVKTWIRKKCIKNRKNQENEGQEG